MEIYELKSLQELGQQASWLSWLAKQGWTTNQMPGQQLLTQLLTMTKTHRFPLQNVEVIDTFAKDSVEVLKDFVGEKVESLHSLAEKNADALHSFAANIEVPIPDIDLSEWLPRDTTEMPKKDMSELPTTEISADMMKGM